MPELVCELIISIDGFARGQRSPGYFDYFGPDFGNWIKTNSAAPPLMKWAKDHEITFDRLVAGEVESYTGWYEAYLTDYRIEPRKLLWDVELSIKIADD